MLCDLYAKFIAVLVQHWLLLTACWRWPDRSWTRAARTMQWEAPTLSGALGSRRRLIATLRALQRCLQATDRLTKRKHQPSTAQTLLEPAWEGLS